MSQMSTALVPINPGARPVPKIMPLLRGTLWGGGLIVLAFFGIFGGWAAMAPLSSGALASGVVSPDTSRKVIQHLEGGIIREVLVREGQRVQAGDVLMVLESVRTEALFAARREQWMRLQVMRARLEAHVLDLETMPLPQEVAEATDPAILDFVKTQQRLFDIRRTTQLQQEAIFERQIEQQQSEVAAVEAENEGLANQSDFIGQELIDKTNLLEQQLISRSEVQALQREQARLQSALAANRSRIARVGQSIEETRLSILQAREAFQDQLALESTDVNNQIAQIDEEMVSTGDALDRLNITSPVDGQVLNLRNQTPGGVVRAGEPIMDIVPLDDDMIILAKLAPRDIDLVTVGMQAHVSLIPFASSSNLPLNGEVVQIAADSSMDELTRQYYYQVRVRVPLSELAKHTNMYMSPGMPADVTVVTGKRTMLQYLGEPLLRSIRNAFVYD